MTTGFVRVRFVDPQDESTLFGPIYECLEEWVFEVNQKLHAQIAIPGISDRTVRPIFVGLKMEPPMGGPDYCIFYRN